MIGKQFYDELVANTELKYFINKKMVSLKKKILPININHWRPKGFLSKLNPCE